MTPWTVRQLLDATGGTLLAPCGSSASDPVVTGIGLDSRHLQPGHAFLAIRGPRFNAHDFLEDAIARGAACVIVQERPAATLPVPAMLVPDTVKALGALAASYRKRFSCPVIAITGSCGKTTTKDLIAHLLRATGAQVLRTSGTQNNHIGVPLTLLRLTEAHDYAVIELGSNHPGEIASLASVAQPTVAVVTNIGPAHLEFFGSVEAIRREKLSLLKALGAGGSAVVPGDQLEVLLEAKACLHPQARLLTFGTADHCGMQGVEIRRDGHGFALQVREVPGTFAIPLPGFHNVENVLAALACLQVLGRPLVLLGEALRSFVSVPMRSELIRCNGFMVMNDCSNANPLSFARALEALHDLPATRRVVIAGDMMELGPAAKAAHQAIGRLTARYGIELVMAVGAFASDVAQGAATSAGTLTLTYRTVQELLAHLPTGVRNGDSVLIKGSRKMALEQVTAQLQALAVQRHPHGS